MRHAGYAVRHSEDGEPASPTHGQAVLGPQQPLGAPHRLLSRFPYGNRKSLVCLCPSTLSVQVVCVGGVEPDFSLTEEL